MIILSVLGTFAAFGIGGCVMAALIQQKRFPTWLAIALSPVACAGVYLLMLGMPFVGWAGEALVVFVTGLSVGFPLLAFFRVGNAMKATKTVPKVAAVAMGVFLPLFPLTLFTLLSRLNEAAWLEWKCDGRIVEVTRAKSNHQAPTIVVEDGSGTVRFEQVDDNFWSVAKPGQRLTKTPGTPTAVLDGVRVRMVPRQVGWWNEPK